MKILGFDPSLVSTGWAVMDTDATGGVKVSWGSIKTSPKDSLTLRLHKIWDSVTYLVQDVRPDSIAMEAPFMGRNVDTAIKLGQVQAVIRIAAYNPGRHIAATYPPKTVKRAVAGNGDATKEDVRRALLPLLGLDAASMEKMSDDCSDAMAVALTHHLLQEPGGSGTL